MENKRDEGKGVVKGEKKMCMRFRKTGHDIENCWSKPKMRKKSTPPAKDKYDVLKAELDKLNLNMKRSKVKEKSNITKDDSHTINSSTCGEEDLNFCY